MSDSRGLLQSIETFLTRRAMAPSTFGRLAVNDGKLVKRLRDGGSVTLETGTKIAAFINAETEAEQAPSATPAR